MDLSRISEAFEDLRLGEILDQLRDPDLADLPDLTVVRKARLRGEAAKPVASALVLAGKRLAMREQSADALRAYELARDLGDTSQLLVERISLTRKVVPRTSIEWKVALQDFQRETCICTKGQCRCSNHYEMAECLGMFGGDFPAELTMCGVNVSTLGNYYSWTKRTIWSKLIERLKHNAESEVAKYMARVAADYVQQSHGKWSDIDAMVPVPPSTSKFGKRGFAPTDLLVQEMSACLGVPHRMSLVRYPGVATRDASDEELSKQFALEERGRAELTGRHILLVEDVVTTGRTVRICSEVLQQISPASVAVFSMAKSSRI
ncbi:MAG: hypothetical protein KJZ84_18000 [Bryobacteraceae bacterium]|nr:hypothetical protein [Bryobacteraceae bacterium]